jgi:hypothetical protein
MRTVLILAILAAGGTGSERHGSPEPLVAAHVVGPFSVSGGIAAGGVIYEWRTPRPIAISRITWNESTAGIGTSMTYRLEVDGEQACTITVACDTSGMVEGQCAARANASSVLKLEVATDNCLVGNPAGGLMLTAR